MPDEDPTTGGQQGAPPDQRTGEDTRRRGWFWHWNTIVTQYSPLIGLKGVGLLNSYTVWTDRREDSPHRGFAFPSQQSEASFYGEDRAELITINKILVTLDLIEVRKEMVLHVDDKGRRWRVPHNLYRVKDNPNGFTLTVEDVLRVAELAAKTPAVYRYIRRVFSPNFAPIDARNPWREILPAVRQTELWQKLAARAAREDARASARSKAGHRKRKGKIEANDETPAQSPGADETQWAPVIETRHDDTAGAEPKSDEVAHASDTESSVATSNTDEFTDVQDANNGSTEVVADANRGSNRKTPTTDEGVNEGDQSIVQPVNTTYNQESLNTTRTTTVSDVESTSNDDHEWRNPPLESGSGPILQGSRDSLAAFESANDRLATALERDLLGELERDFAHAAQQAGSTGSGWVVQAIREAVNSGSRFVAPKRVREILNRWSASQGRNVRQAGEAEISLEVSEEGANRDELGQAWRAIIQELMATQELAEFHDALAGSVLLGEVNGQIRVGLSQANVPDNAIRHIQHALLPRFVTRLGRDVSVLLESGETPLDPQTESQRETTPTAAHPSWPTKANPLLPQPKFTVTDGLSNTQVWAAAQDELQQRLSSGNFETWIRPASLIGRDDAGKLVLGVPSRFAQQRVDARLREDIEAVLSRIVGDPVEVRVELSQHWLRLHAGDDPDSG